MLKSLLVVLIVAFSSVGWGFQIQSENFLMYFEKVILIVQGRDNYIEYGRVEYNNTNTVVKYDVKSPSATEKSIDLEMQKPPGAGSPISVSKFILTLNLVEVGGYFILSNTTANIHGQVTVENKPNNFGNQTHPFQLITEIALEAPRERSFHCNRFGRLYPDANAVIGNFTPAVEFIKLQMQAFTNGTDSSKPIFLDSWDCVGFFTIGIWSGIFIASILIGIITLGLAMIMDVKTNDRFDDPKGKAISFGGVE